MIEVVLVDDEKKALESLQWELSNFSAEVEVIATFTDPAEALVFLQRQSPDCIFLDIEMPTMDGFQFLEKMPDKEVPVVITTAYDQYAIQAIKKEALDYLLKPIDSDDLEDTLSKLRKRRADQELEISTPQEISLQTAWQTQSQKKITINADGKLLFLEDQDILYAQSDGNYSTLYLSDGRKIVLTKKLKEIELLLPGNVFFRIHNSYIINLNKVKEYLKTDGYVVLESNHKIPVSRKKKSAFLNLI
jgi:two-component system LytT family response regulator